MVDLTKEQLKDLRSTYFTPEQAKEFLDDFFKEIDVEKLSAEQKAAVKAINALPTNKKEEFINKVVKHTGEKTFQHAEAQAKERQEVESAKTRALSVKNLMTGLADFSKDHKEYNTAISAKNALKFFSDIGNSDLEDATKLADPALQAAFATGVTVIGEDNLGRTAQASKQASGDGNSTKLNEEEKNKLGNGKNILLNEEQFKIAITGRVEESITDDNVLALVKHTLEAIKKEAGDSPTPRQTEAIEAYNYVLSAIKEEAVKDEGDDTKKTPLTILKEQKIVGEPVIDLIATAITAEVKKLTPFNSEEKEIEKITVNITEQAFVKWANANTKLSNILELGPEDKFAGTRLALNQNGITVTDIKGDPKNPDKVTSYNYNGNLNIELFTSLGIDLKNPPIADAAMLAELNATKTIPTTTPNLNEDRPDANNTDPAVNTETKNPMNIGLALLTAIIAAITGGMKKGKELSYQEGSHIEAVGIGLNMPGVTIADDNSLIAAMEKGNVKDISLKKAGVTVADDNSLIASTNTSGVPDLGTHNVSGGKNVKINESVYGIVRKEKSESDITPGIG